MSNRRTFRGDWEAINETRVCPGPMFSPQVTPSPPKRARIFCLAQALSQCPITHFGQASSALQCQLVMRMLIFVLAWVAESTAVDDQLALPSWSPGCLQLAPNISVPPRRLVSDSESAPFGLEEYYGWAYLTGIGRERETSAHT